MDSYTKQLTKCATLITVASQTNIIILIDVLALLLLVSYTINYIWFLLYAFYIYMDDIQERGGRRIEWIYNSLWYNYIQIYFNMKLVREQELNPEKSYLFGYHPHGIWSIGFQTTFRQSNPEFKKLFPGIDMSLLVMGSFFQMPLIREFYLAMGCCSVSKKSMIYILTSKKPKSAILVPGGADEIFKAEDHVADLVLAKRFGFIKVAIETGTDLVPVYAFGETSIYHLVSPKQNIILNSIQLMFKKLIGFKFPFFYYGRGLEEDSLGIFPFQKQITVVVGKPISVTKNPNPSKEEVSQLHRTYCNSLIELYNKHKERYHVGELPVPELKFV